MSFLSRMGVEMGNAILDAYGNLVYGDDAGKSAKLVFVARPRILRGGGGGAKPSEATNGGGGGAQSPSGGGGDPTALAASGGAVDGGASSGGESSAGASSTEEPRFDLGMTFIEVNGRAYVQTVTPEGDAAMAGVQPRDAVQFAFVHTDVAITSARTSEDQDERAARFALEQERKGARTGFDELCDMFPFDVTSSPFAERGGKGGGGGGAVPGGDGGVGSSGAAGRGGGAKSQGGGDAGVGGEDDDNSVAEAERMMMMTGGHPHHPPHRPQRLLPHERRESEDSTNQLSDMKSLVREEGRNLPYGSGSGGGGGGGGVVVGVGGLGGGPGGSGGGRRRRRRIVLPVDARGDPIVYPVTLVFRRTRQRKRLVGGGMPHLFIPNFRLDDECDRAALLVQKLAPTADMAPREPDAWDELVHDGTEWLFPDGSILPPVGVGDGGGADAAAGGGQAVVAASAAAALKRVDSGEFDNVKTGEDTIPQDSWEAMSTAKIRMVKQRMHEEAKLRAAEQRKKSGGGGGGGGSVDGGMAGEEEGAGGVIQEDVEAATIRSMIQKAVGLAFVRTSKVVLGVSIHCGSGIVIARLPDGTWSAPSAIGTWGLGLGLQFGLEVADYIFILQTEDSLAHFKSGGNFTIGGNVGAAVAGLGREAYGAASLKGSMCGGGGGGGGSGGGVESDAGIIAPYLQDDVSTSVNGGGSDNSALFFAEGGSSSRSLLHGRAEGSGGGGGAGNVDGGGGISGDDYATAAEVAPIVAYAKSQGLYFGVSLEGSRIFTRNDLNARAYKFTTGRAVGAHDILSGKVATPPEAEDLYASLHSVEFAHELSFLPRPPQILRGDSPNDWRFDRSTLNATAAERRGGRGTSSSSANPFSFFSTITDKDTEECSDFETKFKQFLYGGVSVQRLVPNAQPTGGKTRRERRTLWLMLPEVGSLRLGFISKQNDVGGQNDASSSQRNRGASTGSQVGDGRQVPNSGRLSNAAAARSHRGEDYSATDDYTDGGGSLYTDYSDYMSVDENATQMTGDYSTGTNNRHAVTDRSRAEQREAGGAARNFRSGKVHLSDKYSMALTDVTCLSQEPKVSIRFSPDDATEHLRVISIQNVKGTSLLFLANNFREAELLMCGLKLLLERETARLGFRGGVSITRLGDNKVTVPSAGPRFPRSPNSRNADFSDEDDSLFSKDSQSQNNISPARVPEGRQSWSKVPGRDYLREQASRSQTSDETYVNNSIRNAMMAAPEEIPSYSFGELIIREVASKIPLMLPLPLSRALLLDSSSPVITKWEAERGDSNYSKSKWAFPPATPRELEQYSTEHQLIASGSMMGAYRTSTYDRVRNGQSVTLTETHIVDADDDQKLALTVTERTPRRGFSVKVRILLRPTSRHSCEATVLGEVRPMGKNMSNKVAVHKAFCLVVNEITMRYGTQGKGLLGAFINAINENPSPPSPSARSVRSQESRGSTNLPRQHLSSADQQHGPRQQSKLSAQTASDYRQRQPSADQRQPATTKSVPPPPPRRQGASTAANDSAKAIPPPPPRGRKNQSSDSLISFEEVLKSDRATNKVVSARDELMPASQEQKKSSELSIFPEETEPMTEVQDEKKPVTIEVKPLPKIRLSLMPAPREEDEDNASSSTGRSPERSKNRKKSGARDKKKRSSRRSNSGKEGRSKRQ